MRAVKPLEEAQGVDSREKLRASTDSHPLATAAPPRVEAEARAALLPAELPRAVKAAAASGPGQAAGQPLPGRQTNGEEPMELIQQEVNPPAGLAPGPAR